MAHSVLSKRVASLAKRSLGVRYLSWGVEAAGAYLLWSICWLLPVAWASRFAGWLIGVLGPRSHKHRHVLHSLTIVLGGDEKRARALARAHWRNLGMVLGEYPHLKTIINTRMTIAVASATRERIDAGQACVFVGLHQANWEAAAGAITALVGPFAAVYSAHSNPLVDRALRFFRDRAVQCIYLAKDSSLRQWLREGQAGRSLGLLADQRVDDAPSIEFFGVPAEMTQTPVRLALRLKFPLVCFHVEREQVARYRVYFDAPISAGKNLGKEAAEQQAESAMTKDKEQEPVVEVMGAWVKRLEELIRSAPQDWLCAKRRWPKG